MATEIVLPSAVVSFGNFLFAPGASVLTTSTEATMYPATNLASPYRSKRWRSIGVTACNLDFDLGAAQFPIVVGLIDSNIDPGYNLVVTAASDAAFSTAVETWTFTGGTYIQDPVSKVLLWYLGNTDADLPMAGKRYWRITLATGSTSATYFEVGVPWFGSSYLLTHDLGWTRRVDDPSSVSIARSGAKYFDRQRVGRQLAFRVQHEILQTVLSIERAVDACGGSLPVLIDLYAPFRDDPQRKAQGSYYGYLDQRGGLQSAYRFEARGDVAFQFDEAVA